MLNLWQTFLSIKFSYSFCKEISFLTGIFKMLQQINTSLKKFLPIENRKLFRQIQTDTNTLFLKFCTYLHI